MELLRSIGYGPDWESAFGELGIDPGCVPGRVSEDRGAALGVLCEAGELRAQVSGRLQYQAASPEDLPCVGDWVAVLPTEGGAAVIHAVLPRRTALVRNTPERVTRAQVLAANVDRALVVTSANRDFNPRRVERTLMVVAQSGASPVVVLSKVDLCDDVGERLEALGRAAPGAPVVAVSSVSGEGLEGVREQIAAGETGVLIGSSGVGKSTLVNRLLGQEVQVTRETREDDDRGRHATSHRQLLRLPSGGVLIDTPGMREIALFEDGEEVSSVFPELAALAEQCRFRDCQHQGEPGCEVEAGLADGRLDPDRLAHMKKLEREAAAVRARRDAQARHQRRKEQKVFARHVRSLNAKRRSDRDPRR